MKRLIAGIGLTVAVACLTASVAQAASYSLKFIPMKSAGSGFTGKSYQRLENTRKSFVPLTLRRSTLSGSSSGAFMLPNNNKGKRISRVRKYSRPERTPLTRDPSARISGRKSLRVRRFSRWSSNR